MNPNSIQQVVLNLVENDHRDLAWQLIDIYQKSATTLPEFDAIGYAALKSDKRDSYLYCAESAYALAQTSEEKFLARANLYKAYNALNQPEKALFYIQQNLEIDPNDFESLCHQAFNISLMGDKLKAEAQLEELVNKFPDRKQSLESAFASKHLREGRTAQGILSFIEADKPKNTLFETKLPLKKWNGIINPGKIIYVDIEGGIGDQIINIRFFDRISSYGMTPILVSREDRYYNDTNKLFTRHGYQVITDLLEIDSTQYWAPMMSLPGYMGLTENQLWQKPYLTPKQNSKNKLASDRPKIGIKCSGNPYFAQDEYRKIPLNEILEIIPNDVDIYYIDKEPCNNPSVIDLADRIESWEDTLDFIDQMDMIVSSCTSLVHAAGAMGKPTCVAVPIAEYYIWTTTKNDGSSPWYGDNFFVARQTKVRSWKEPLNEIKMRIKTFI